MIYDILLDIEVNLDNVSTEEEKKFTRSYNLFEIDINVIGDYQGCKARQGWLLIRPEGVGLTPVQLNQLVNPF